MSVALRPTSTAADIDVHQGNHYEDSGEDMDNEGEDDHYEDSGEDMDEDNDYEDCGDNK